MNIYTTLLRGYCTGRFIVWTCNLCFQEGERDGSGDANGSGNRAFVGCELKV